MPALGPVCRPQQRVAEPAPGQADEHFPAGAAESVPSSRSFTSDMTMT